MPSPFDYVRTSYGVPAYRGARVWLRGVAGAVTSAKGGYIWIRFDGQKRSQGPFHPVDALAWDRETPAHRRPCDPLSGIPGWGYYVWAEVCHGFGISLYEHGSGSHHPALLEPWPRDPRALAAAA